LHSSFLSLVVVSVVTACERLNDSRAQPTAPFAGLAGPVVRPALVARSVLKKPTLPEVIKNGRLLSCSV